MNRQLIVQLREALSGKIPTGSAVNRTASSNSARNSHLTSDDPPVPGPAPAAPVKATPPLADAGEKHSHGQQLLAVQSERDREKLREKEAKEAKKASKEQKKKNRKSMLF